MQKVTIDDVAELAGVSIKTVSRVVNREPNVRESTRVRVDQAIAKLNYTPNSSARNLASRRSHLVGLVYDDPSAYEVPSSGYVIMLQQGLLKACKDAGYDLLIHPFNYRDPQAAKALKLLIEHSRLDGIVLAPPLSNMPAITRAIDSTNTPLVRIAPGSERKHKMTVTTNDRAVCADMVEYLAGLGHTRIAFVTGHGDHKAVGNRFAGYQDGLERCGIKFRKELVVAGDNSIGSGEVAADRLLKRRRPPTAIFAANDDMAAGILRVAHRRGIAVPEDLSVAGFDDIPLAQQIFPALTTVRQPLREMAEHAAGMLIENLRTPTTTPGPDTVEGEIVVRDSTGPVSVDGSG